MRPVASVIGAGGLLGSAMMVATRRSATAVTALSQLDWHDPAAAARTIVARHRELVARHPDQPLMVMWCAGAGRVGTPADVMSSETELLGLVVADLCSLAATGHRTAFCLAGSGGGVWSGSSETVLREDVPARPWHDYGRAKLAQEQVVAQLVAASDAVALVGRISNLFGCPPDAKPLTGLVNTMASNALRRHPTGIYVPLDTQRDFITATAAARLLHDWTLRSLANDPGGSVTTRVVAAGTSVTIGTIADTIGRVIGRKPLISVGFSATASQQPRILAFRSLYEDLPAHNSHLAHEIDTLVHALLARRP